MRLWMLSLLLASVTSFGSLVTISFAEIANSEEAKVELTEFEVDVKEGSIIGRRSRVKRRVRQRTTENCMAGNAIANFLNQASSPELIISCRQNHNGCGSHLRI